MKFLIYLALVFSTSLYAGSIHKWVDDEGNVYYGDAPPVSTATKEVRVIGAPSDPGKALPRLSGSDSENSSRNSAAADPDPSTVPEDQAKIACDNAREDLRVISKSSRVKLKSADGSTRYMTTEEIEERRKVSEEEIAQFCQ